MNVQGRLRWGGDLKVRPEWQRISQITICLQSRSGKHTHEFRSSIVFFFFFLVVPGQHFSSSTRDWICASWSGSMGSYPLDHQGIPKSSTVFRLGTTVTEQRFCGQHWLQTEPLSCSVQTIWAWDIPFQALTHRLQFSVSKMGPRA